MSTSVQEDRTVTPTHDVKMMTKMSTSFLEDRRVNNDSKSNDGDSSSKESPTSPSNITPTTLDLIPVSVTKPPKHVPGVPVTKPTSIPKHIPGSSEISDCCTSESPKTIPVVPGWAFALIGFSVFLFLTITVLCVGYFVIRHLKKQRNLIYTGTRMKMEHINIGETTV
jgi:hypothetical protein